MGWAGYVACMAMVIISYRILAVNRGGQRELTKLGTRREFYSEITVKDTG
jgi:hypothetical protein